MRTLILAEAPFRDLRSHALLHAAAARLQPTGTPMVAMKEGRPPPGFEAVPFEPDPAALGVERVVLAGAFFESASLYHALGTAERALAAGARLEAAAFSLDRAGSKRQPPPKREVLDRAARLEVRDAHTANALLVWRVSAPFRIRGYPEREIAADPALAATLPDGKVLGLGMLGGKEYERFWRAHLPALRERLSPFAGWKVLPLLTEAPGSWLDDLPGSLAFLEEVLPGADVLLPELRDPAWRKRQMTPARLRGLVARCGLVVTSQDLPAAMGFAAGVPVLGLSLGQGAERRVVSAFATLANEVSAGSDLVYLHAPKP